MDYYEQESVEETVNKIHSPVREATEMSFSDLVIAGIGLIFLAIFAATLTAKYLI